MTSTDDAGVLVRAMTATDAGDWSAVMGAAAPYLVQDARGTRYLMRHELPETVRLVARDGAGRPLGVARLADRPEALQLTMVVHPDHRARGVGAALLRALRDPIAAAATRGVTGLISIVDDDDASVAVAQHWGFMLTREYQLVQVDPATLPAESSEPMAGVEFASLADVDPEVVWRLRQAIAADDPSGLTTATPLERWLTDWRDPLHRLDLGVAALAGGQLIGFSQVSAVGTRGWNDLTGTSPDHRGRGIALACKVRALQRCAAAGITAVTTGNDRSNAPMVAINDRLGYRLLTAPRLGVVDLREWNRPA